MLSSKHRLSLRKPSWAALALGLVTRISAWASPVLIIRSSDNADDDPTTQAVANLSALQVTAGNTVTVAVDLPASLAGYSQVCDLGFRLRLDDDDRADHVSYLQQGGRLAVFGDNEFVFGNRNRNGDIRQLIADAGGGTVHAQNVNGDSTQTARAPFNLSGAVASVNLLAPGMFDAQGNGSWVMALADDSGGSGLFFDGGELVNAGAGTLLSVLDVDILGNFAGQFGGAGGALARNMVDVLTNGGTVQVPEPPVGALVVLALLAAGLARRSRPAAPRLAAACA